MGYKDELQELADNIAWDKYGKDFYDLPEKLRDKVYEEAQEVHTDTLASLADSMAEERKFSGGQNGS